MSEPTYVKVLCEHGVISEEMLRAVHDAELELARCSSLLHARGYRDKANQAAQTAGALRTAFFERTRRCSHEESLHGRCTACGMTWEQQAAMRDDLLARADRWDEEPEALIVELVAEVRRLREQLRARIDYEASFEALAHEICDKHGAPYTNLAPAVQRLRILLDRDGRTTTDD